MTVIDSTINRLQRVLIAHSNVKGYWSGELSSSALSTATAVFALAAVDKNAYSSYIDSGIRWLIKNQNPDGGWGDTTKSKSNLSTTLLVYSAMAVASPGKDVIHACEKYISSIAGSIDPEDIVRSILAAYGSDRTFSYPILTMCALAGRLGNDGWKYVHGLPFELAVLPQKWFKWLNLPVVSYALPALIAIGQVVFHYHPPVNPVPRIIRRLTLAKSLKVLTRIQPENGGFLEATPLTSFVLMSLASCGNSDNIVVKKGSGFLIDSQRQDGSWPIDTNLATWVSTMAIQALDKESVSTAQREALLDWLLNQQHSNIHQYTMAEPGGWAWTDLPGGVPDADDTSGALMAIKGLDPDGEKSIDAVESAILWLINLQNRDGGIPTFCRGWGRLPFDRSSTDITAHAMAAWSVWKPFVNKGLQKKIKQAMHKGCLFLKQEQRTDGAWIPLWFGNEHVRGMVNPVYGTAKVLSHLNSLGTKELEYLRNGLKNGIEWLLNVQQDNGLWGGDADTPTTIEETALALDALAGLAQDKALDDDQRDKISKAVIKGAQPLIEIVSSHDMVPASPIGLYFARLWYYEKLYPLIFSLSALRKIRQII